MAVDWYTEKHTPHAGITLEISRRLFDQKSPFQHIEVVETVEYGNMLLLDGCVMITDRDEFVYHEMITHPALVAHPNPQRVLVIGGGDGGTVREVIRHAAVRQVTLVEIDGMVIDVCRKYFPAVACGLDDPRVDVQVADGFAHLDAHQGAYDVILVDSTDPVGPAEVLFTVDFFRKVKAGLAPGGVAVFQSENPLYWGDLIAKMHRDLAPLFAHVGLYLASIPTYPGGLWSFSICSDVVDARKSPAPAPLPFQDQLKYFTPAVFKGAFALPQFVKKLVQP